MTAALLESADGVNDHGNYFKINLHQSYLDEQGFELATLDMQSDAPYFAHVKNIMYSDRQAE